ncbi:YkuJ family protein [Heyndrickxia acidiproducens]|uniref:YkuJ family protein n=1 Tax=Heyndrickxia acidiproducens TaxID=1121084 RepID=UPI000376C6B3|nr:YkuJ family protein [Heyndrickxia acidiproducens]
MSQLLGIIQRLQAMQEATDTGEVQQRHFEVNGKTLCQVKFFPATNTFELEVYDDKKHSNKYQFDDLDIAAIEIFDIVQEGANA